MCARVLTTGTDDTLIQTRAAILRMRYEVTVCRPEVTLPELHRKDYDLLLACYSIPHEQANRIIRQARLEFPMLYIVRLLCATSPPIARPMAHKLVEINFDPALWIHAVDQLLNTPKKIA